MDPLHLVCGMTQGDALILDSRWDLIWNRDILHSSQVSIYYAKV